MNAEQLRLFLSGAFANETEAAKIMKRLRPWLADTLRQVRDLVEILPSDSLTRQRQWRIILPAIEEVMGPYNDAFMQILQSELPATGEKAAVETLEQLKSVGAPIPAGQALAPEFVMADSTKRLLTTRINNQRLVDLFTQKDGTSPFMKASRRLVDRVVTGGIIRGEETQVIAAKLIPYLSKAATSQAVALARTAIQDYNRQVKEEVWDANADALTGLRYEWVAALDSRTCPTCAPLDGMVKDAKSDFPRTPVHVNCRCTVVIVDPDDEGQVRFGQEALTEKPTGDGAYKTTKEVKGEELYRRNRQVDLKDNGNSPRYADFLASAGSKTKQMFFGGGNAGTKRAERFDRFITNGMTPQQALLKLVSVPDKNTKRRKFKPIKD